MCHSANTVTLTNPLWVPLRHLQRVILFAALLATGLSMYYLHLQWPIILFSINNGLNFQASPLFTGLLMEPYLVKAKDNTSIVYRRQQVPVLYSPAFVSQATTNNVNNTDCLAPNGSITISAPTPTSGFTFSKDGGISFQASNLFSNLPGGTYSVVVKSNASGCTSTAVCNHYWSGYNDTFCYHFCKYQLRTGKNGSITFNAPASKGTGYVYSIDGGTTYQAGNVFSNLNGGTYPVMVRNTTTNCVSAVQKIPQLIQLLFHRLFSLIPLRQSNCSISDGTITFYITSAGGKL